MTTRTLRVLLLAALALLGAAATGCRGDDPAPPDVFYDLDAYGHYPDGADVPSVDASDVIDAASLDGE